MTHEEVRALTRLWQERLGLGHWRLELHFVESNEISGRAAQCVVHDDYERAIVTFSNEVAQWEPGYCEELVVHELVHVLLDPLEVAAGDARAQLHPDAQALAEKQLLHALERATERLAWSLVALTAPSADT